MTIKSATRITDRQTAARRAARIIGAGEDGATQTGRAGMPGGVHKSGSGGRLGFGGQRSGRPRLIRRSPDVSPIHIRAKPFATDACGTFNERAFICGNFALAVAPKADRLGGNPKPFRQLCDAAGGVDGFVNWFHAIYSTHVERANLQLCLIYFQHLFNLAKWP